MIAKSKERDILKSAVDACIRETGLNIHLRHVKDDDSGADAVIVISVQGQEVILKAEVREAITRANALLLLMKQNRPDRHIIVTRQVTTDLAGRLRDNGIQFMDESGNVHINHPPLFVFVKGNRNPSVPKAPSVGRAFKQTGLQVIFALLCIPDLVNRPYRTIAAHTGAALGMVNWTMQELRELGFLEETGTKRARQARLINRKVLLDRWITGYTEQLRPRLVYGRYTGAPGWWRSAALDPATALWGGEVAAERMTHHLKAQDATLYVDRDNPGAVLLENRLRKDPAGNVELLYRFWNQDVIKPSHDMAPPLLVYADLVATGDQRNLEAARLIYDESVVQLIRED